MPDDVASLHAEYTAITATAQRFLEAISTQLTELLKQNSITLGVPIEARVKTWESIREKLERKTLDLTSVKRVQDLVGFRLIFLFARDLKKASGLLRETFAVVSAEGALDRLGESQFGYQSFHYVVRVPAQWLPLPTFKGCDGLTAEIQMRTLAQHI